ncbi:MAG: hypothetical protein ABW202_23655 [Duganella sp.]
MNWLISAGSVKQKQRPASLVNTGGSRPLNSLSPLNLRVSSHHEAGQWHLFSSPSGLTSDASAKKMWQDVLSALVEK